MKGSVFEQLPALQRVNLADNECIDQEFREEQISDISQAVYGACGFDKNRTSIVCEEIDAFGYYFFDDDSVEMERSFHSDDYFCRMKNYTTIRDITYTISNPFNDKVKYMEFSGNRNVNFLPISLFQKFPNITWIYAARCAIREISNRNFEGLVHLKEVQLAENHIYAILRNTFEGLVNLKWLDLSKLKLLYLLGR